MEFTRQNKISWLAGFTDGEGCFSLYCYVDKRGKRNTLAIKPFLDITQSVKNKKGINFVEMILKENKIKYTKYNHKKVCGIRVLNRNVKDVVELLIPYLIIKKSVAQHIIKYWDLRQRVRANNNQYAKKKYTIDWKQIRKFTKWVDKFREYNTTRNHKWNGKKIIQFYKDLIKNYEVKR